MSGALVIAEARRGDLRDITFELIAAARALASDSGGEVKVCVIAANPAPHAEHLNVDGVAEVLTVTAPTEHFEAHVQARAVAEVIASTRPDVVLAGHTIDSMGFGAAVAMELDLGFATDVTSLRWKDGALSVERGAYGDRLVETLDFPGRSAALVLVRPGVYAPVSPGGGGAGVRDAGVSLDSAVAATEHLGFEEADGGDVDIAKADFLLAIGRGVEEQSDVQRMLELAESIGATLASSRPLVDAGWLPAARQVGQSGRTVAPKVYLALGISGAVQHVMGMHGADTIIAVNTDPDAPIFAVADYGAVADLHEVSEALPAHFETP